jgi:hypothetical protein
MEERLLVEAPALLFSAVRASLFRRAAEGQRRLVVSLARSIRAASVLGTTPRTPHVVTSRAKMCPHVGGGQYAAATPEATTAPKGRAPGGLALFFPSPVRRLTDRDCPADLVGCMIS